MYVILLTIHHSANSQDQIEIIIWSVHFTEEIGNEKTGHISIYKYIFN